jgi:hypothetical protein
MAKITQKTLDVWLKKWQKILRLEDWDIKVFLQREYAISAKGASGCCDYQLTKKSGSIQILDPIDYHPRAVHPDDAEATLVHELIHFHFAPFFVKASSDVDEDNYASNAMEVAVDTLARALIALDRAKRP